MSTYQEVQDRINSDYLNRTDLTAETQRAIKAAIRFYEHEPFPWNEAITTLTTVASTAYIAVPTDFVALNTLQITRSSADYLVKLCDFNQILEYNVTRAIGWPTDFALYANRFYFSPIPDSAYTVPCYYIRQLSALSATSDTNDWLSAAEDLIVYTATKIMWANVLRDQEEAMTYAALEQNEVDNLRKYNSWRTMQGIRATRF